MALALTFVLGRVILRTACLPFTRGSDGGRSNRAVTRNRVGRGRESGNATRSVVVLSRVGQGWESGDASRVGTGNRIYRPVLSLLACVQ